MALTARQQRFVDEYLIDLNATQAAIRAGYSAKRADAIGYDLLRKPEIQAEIERLKELLSERIDITHDRIMAEWSKVGFVDTRRLYDKEGQLIPMHKLPSDITRAISSIDVDADGKVRVRFWDKNKALAEMASRVPAPVQVVEKPSDDDDDAFTANMMSLVNAANKLRG